MTRDEFPSSAISVVQHLDVVLAAYDRNSDMWEDGDAEVYRTLSAARTEIYDAVEKRDDLDRLSDEEADRLRRAVAVNQAQAAFEAIEGFRNG